MYFIRVKSLALVFGGVVGVIALWFQMDEKGKCFAAFFCVESAHAKVVALLHSVGEQRTHVRIH